MKYPEHRYLSMIVTWIALSNLQDIAHGNTEAVMEQAVKEGWIEAPIINGDRVVSVTDKGRKQAEWLLDQTDPKAAIQ